MGEWSASPYFLIIAMQIELTLLRTASIVKRCPPVNKHSNGKPPFPSIGNTSTNGGISSQLCSITRVIDKNSGIN